MTRGKALILAAVLIVILSVFVVLASMGGKNVVSPIPEEPKIIWIKPTYSPTPLATSSPTLTPSAKSKVLVTPKPAATSKPPASVSATIKPSSTPSITP